MSAHALKDQLQLALDTGEIANMDRLFERARAHGLLITRNGRDYIGLRDANGKRFRLRFNFENHTRPPRSKPAAIIDPVPNPHKELLQSLLGNGEISGMQQLLAHLAAHELVVTVARPRSLGLRGSDGRAFAISLPFELSIHLDVTGAAVRRGGALSQVPPDLRADLQVSELDPVRRKPSDRKPRAISTFLQRAVDAGEISTMEQLLSQVTERGLHVVRSVEGCVTLGAGRARFRVRYDFSGRPQVTRAPTVPSLNRHIWVYALTAFSRDGAKCACYIGKTVDLSRRIREHVKVLHGGRVRGSYELFAWAGAEGVEVRVTVLAVMDVDWFQSPHLEGYWLKLAQEAGCETPGADRWGRLPRPLQLQGQPCTWPCEKVALSALALDDIVERVTVPVALYEFVSRLAEQGVGA